MNDKGGLQSVSIALFCFLERFFGGAGQIITTFVYCAGADLHPLVNNNTLTQQGSCIATKTLVKSICLGAQHHQLNY